MGKDTRELREEIENTRDRMGDTVDAIAYKTDVPSRMQDAVNDRVESVKSIVTGTVGHVRHGIEHAGTRVGNALPDPGDVQDAAGSIARSVRENPLGLLLGGVAVGFLIGSLLPVSRVEDERLGDVRNRIGDTARDAGGQLISQGKAVVRDTIAAASESAQEHGREAVRSMAGDRNPFG